MNFLNMRSPAPFRLTARDMGLSYNDPISSAFSPIEIFKKKAHDAHPSLDHLVLLVFEAVMEVVCVALPGYIIARLGEFDADKQKFLAELNVRIFTPCLIFTKLASQLNAEALVELGVIPVIFVVQTLVSYVVAMGVAKLFRFNRRASNFVTAMGVFGNSNSLPISLVISLSQTLKGLHWDQIPGDNDDEVAARGILYLLIFQQLGQLVRWSWGYHVLLAPKDKYPEYHDNHVRAEEGRYLEEEPQDEDEIEALIPGLDSIREMGEESHVHLPHAAYGDHHNGSYSPTRSENSEGYEPAGRTPTVGTSRASPNDSEDEEHEGPRKRHGSFYKTGNGIFDGSIPDTTAAGIESFPRINNADEMEVPQGVKGLGVRSKKLIRRTRETVAEYFVHLGKKIYNALPVPAQNAVLLTQAIARKVNNFMWQFMNPPLWAMLIAVFVASIPSLQELFFEEGSFVKNSVTNAVQSTGGVAVPLILVVLGANLARSTPGKHDEHAEDPEEKQIGTRLLIASLLSRMVIPFIVMAPILALTAKFVPVSILDDPIFIIVCFLLVGAPSALQLAQICQINGVYENVMSRILFQSYVVWILPSTLILVMTALEVVEWAK